MFQSKVLNFLKFSVFFTFIGRAYQYIYKSVPVRSLLWDEEKMSGILNYYKVDYEEFVTADKYEMMVDSWVGYNGYLLLLAAIFTLLLTKKNVKFFAPIIIVASLSLTFLSYLQFLDNSYAKAMFWEHSLQFATPLVMIYYVISNHKLSVSYLLRLLVAITFVSHGMFAMGELYELPGDFISMLKDNVPFVEHEAAIQTLYIAGILDMIVAVLIFVPKVEKYAMFYCFVWGTLTAFARIGSGLHYGFQGYIWHQYLNETILRFCHGLIPLLLFVMVRDKQKSIGSTVS